MTKTALYRFFDADGKLLYVGITGDIRRRWKQHEQGKPWWPSVAEKAVTWHGSRIDAEIAELEAIRDEEPEHNWQTPNITEEERRQRLRKIRDQIAENEARHRWLVTELNEELFYLFPENRGETGKPRHGLITDLVKDSGKSRQHITDVRAGKFGSGPPRPILGSAPTPVSP